MGTAASAGWLDVFTRPLAICMGISAAIHAAVYLLNTTLPVTWLPLAGAKPRSGCSSRSLPESR